jgi:hypothetical protein
MVLDADAGRVGGAVCRSSFVVGGGGWIVE